MTSYLLISIQYYSNDCNEEEDGKLKNCVCEELENLNCAPLNTPSWAECFCYCYVQKYLKLKRNNNPTNSFSFFISVFLLKLRANSTNMPPRKWTCAFEESHHVELVMGKTVVIGKIRDFWNQPESQEMVSRVSNLYFSEFISI